MSPSEPSSRAGLAWTRVLLIAALLFGFSAMHTLGHLQHEAHASTGSAQLAQPTQAPHAESLYTATDDHGGTLERVAASIATPSSESASALPELDPTSVCLTLGSFVVALLGVAAVAFTRWPGAPADPVAPFRRAPLPPFPTPDQPSLARLQVLRV
ncbi:hypothetical protein [Nocardiopsis eucommiae]|uniref:hypothetical protein n=1 Tax=Nocardiopsis eucommiae TaxID=2831970 RepID=UPI003D7492C4